MQAEPVAKAIKGAIKAGQLPKAKPVRLIKAAVEGGVINQTDAALMQEAEALRTDTIQVDSFTIEEYQQRHTSRKIPMLTRSI